MLGVKKKPRPAERLDALPVIHEGLDCGRDGLVDRHIKNLAEKIQQTHAQ